MGKTLGLEIRKAIVQNSEENTWIMRAAELILFYWTVDDITNVQPWRHEGEEKEEGPEILTLYQSINWYNPMESPGVIGTLSFHYSLYINVYHLYSVYSLEYIALTITYCLLSATQLLLVA